MRSKAGWMVASAAVLLLAGCGKKTLELPADPIERAATCSVIAATKERLAVGVKGELPADAQGRIFHYALLAASAGGSYDPDEAAAVFKRAPALSDLASKTKWEEAKPACDAAYPATEVAAPTLPAAPLDSLLACYMTADFLRKALADQGAAYDKAVHDYSVLASQLDTKVSSALAGEGIKGEAIQKRRRAAQAAAAQLGQPGAVIAACGKKYGVKTGG